jgi:hypothetical protein
LKKIGVWKVFAGIDFHMSVVVKVYQRGVFWDSRIVQQQIRLHNWFNFFSLLDRRIHQTI